MKILREDLVYLNDTYPFQGSESVLFGAELTQMSWRRGDVGGCHFQARKWRDQHLMFDLFKNVSYLTKNIEKLAQTLDELKFICRGAFHTDR